MGRFIAIAFCASLFATSAFAQMTCTALGSYLATQPNISQYVAPSLFLMSRYCGESLSAFRYSCDASTRTPTFR